MLTRISQRLKPSSLHLKSRPYKIKLAPHTPLSTNLSLLHARALATDSKQDLKHAPKKDIVRKYGENAGIVGAIVGDLSETWDAARTGATANDILNRGLGGAYHRGTLADAAGVMAGTYATEDKSLKENIRKAAIQGLKKGAFWGSTVGAGVFGISALVTEPALVIPALTAGGAFGALIGAPTGFKYYTLWAGYTSGPNATYKRLIEELKKQDNADFWNTFLRAQDTGGEELQKFINQMNMYKLEEYIDTEKKFHYEFKKLSHATELDEVQQGKIKHILLVIEERLKISEPLLAQWKRFYIITYMK